MAMDKNTTFNYTCPGDITLLPGIELLPLICDSNADQIAFSRFGRLVGPACYDKTGHNFSRLLPYPNRTADYGHLNAVGGSTIRHNDNLLPGHDIGLLRFSF